MVQPSPLSGVHDLAVSRVRLLPTPLGTAMLFAVAFAAYSAGQRTTAWAPVVLFTVVLVVDATLSRSALAGQRVRLIPTRSRAALPDTIAYRAVVVAGSPERTSIALQLPGITSYGDPTPLAGRSTPVAPLVSHPFVTMHQRYRTTLSVLGFVQATRVGVQLFGERLAQAPAEFDAAFEPTPGIRHDDPGRIRPYVVGDRPNLVNWKATARTGQLHVRDDLIVADEVVVIVEIESATWPAETVHHITHATSLVRLVAQRSWNAGVSVRLVTLHDSDALVRHVAMLEAARQDRAFHVDAAHRPGGPALDLEASVLDAVVQDHDDLIERLGSIAVGTNPGPRPPGAYLIGAHGIRQVEWT